MNATGWTGEDATVAEQAGRSRVAVRVHQGKALRANGARHVAVARGVPRPLERVEASATLCFPSRRRRDEGNYRALLEKALGDALVEGGWLPDDTPDRYGFGAVTFTQGEPRTTVELRCWAREPVEVAA